MWRARVVDFLCPLDELGGFLCGVLDGNNLVVFAVQDQSWDVELLKVLGEIGFGEGLDAFEGTLEARLHAPEPELIQNSPSDLGAGTVGAVKHLGQVLVELRRVLHQAVPKVVKGLDWQALGIGWGL